MIAALLSATIFQKLTLVTTNPAPDLVVGWPLWIIWASMALEGMGLATIFCRNLYRSCFCLSFLFGAFSIAAGWKVFAGHSSCGCFGDFSISPWVALVCDVCVLAVLTSTCALQATRSRQVSQNWLQLMDLNNRKWHENILLALSSVALICILGWFSGERLNGNVTGRVVEYSQKGSAVVATVELINNSEEEIEVIGHSKSCRCLAFDLTNKPIAAKTSMLFFFEISKATRSDIWRHRVKLFLKKGGIVQIELQGA
jgi:hypothetical protein